MVLPTPLPEGLYETMQGSTVAVAVAMVETVVVVVVVEVVVEDESMMVVTVVVTVVVLVADSVCSTHLVRSRCPRRISDSGTLG